MRSRLLTAVAVVALVAVPAAADGDSRRPKSPPTRAPDCQLSDPRGDAPAAFDLTCANVWFGKKTAAGVLTVAATDAAEPPEVVAGASWTLSFTVAGREHRFQRVREAGLSEQYYTFDGGRLNGVKETATEITWTIPRGWVQGSKSGGKPESLSAVAAGLVSRDEAGPAKPR